VIARARRNNNTDGDNFTFAWSDDNSGFNTLFTVNAAGEASYMGSIPNSVSGDVWIRVTDTDQTSGNRSEDSIWVDQLIIRVVNDGPPSAPSAPSSLGAVATGIESIDLAWSDNSGNESGFRIERSDDGLGGWSEVASVGQNVEAWSDSGLAEDTEYFYRVFAFNGVGDSTASNVASATTDTTPPPGAITLSVNGYKVKGSKSYDLTWSGAVSGNVDVYRDGVLRFSTSNDGAHSYDSGEKGGGTHTHRVCELNSTAVCSAVVTTNF
jgi:hypothetical protein